MTDFNNYPYNSYPNYDMYNQGPMPRQAPMGNMYTPHTNKRFVSSLEEAMSLRAMPNSEMVYFDQNKDVLYNIYTDGRGQKTPTIVDLSLHKPEQTATPFDELTERFNKLEKRVEELYGKYNGEQKQPSPAGNE